MSSRQSSTTSQPAPAPAPLPFHKSIVAGAFAGGAELVTMYPLDVVKTRTQLGQATGIFSAMRDIVKKEGVGRLYRGIAAPLSVEPIKRAIKFSANEKYKTMTAGLPAAPYIAGCMAGMTEVCIIAPAEVVKIRMQSSNYVGKYTSTTHGLLTVLKEEGPVAFAKGIEPALWRQGSWNGLYFGIAPQIKERLKQSFPDMSNMTCNLIGGSIGGVLATVVNNPFDVVVSRARNILPGSTVPYQYNWGLPSLLYIGRTEGFRALYKGFGAKVLRLGPGGGIMLVVFNFVADMIR